jgi:hypothetical protein
VSLHRFWVWRGRAGTGDWGRHFDYGGTVASQATTVSDLPGACRRCNGSKPHGPSGGHSTSVMVKAGGSPVGAGRHLGETAYSCAAPFRNRAGQVRLPIRRPAGIKFSAAD